MNIYNLPIDFPSYQFLNVGDMFVLYVGNPEEKDENGNSKVHAHWYQVTVKDKRFALVDLKCLKCENYSRTECVDQGKEHQMSWSKLEFYKDKTRWFRTAASKVLFGSKDIKYV